MSLEAPRRRESPSFSRLLPSSPETGGRVGVCEWGLRGNLAGWRTRTRMVGRGPWKGSLVGVTEAEHRNERFLEGRVSEQEGKRNVHFL